MPESVHESIDVFQVRLYKLTTRSHLRIGAGEGSISLAAVDNPVIQALFYTPPNNGSSESEEHIIYLPGSSLHGVVRAWCEKVQRSVNETFLEGEQLKSKLKELDHNSRESILDAARREVRNYLGLKKEQAVDDTLLYEHWRVHSTICDPLSLNDQCQRFDPEDGAANSAKQQWLQAIGRSVPCPICQVFGYVGQRGRVRVQHAFPANGKLPLDIITRVAINRISGAADEGKLFDVEAVPPGAEFYFFVVLENMGDRYPIFESGIRALQYQLATIGAHSTVGFGTVEIEEIICADLRPSLFIAEDIQGKIKSLVDSNLLIAGASNMNVERYPSFYRALASQGAQEAFGSDVTIVVSGQT